MPKTSQKNLKAWKTSPTNAQETSSDFQERVDGTNSTKVLLNNLTEIKTRYLNKKVGQTIVSNED